MEMGLAMGYKMKMMVCRRRDGVSVRQRNPAPSTQHPAHTQRRQATHLDDGHGYGPNFKGVPSARGLRDDFTKDGDGGSGQQKANQACGDRSNTTGQLHGTGNAAGRTGKRWAGTVGDVSQQNGQHGVHGDVAEQQRAQQQVALGADGGDCFCAFSFRR